MTPANFASYIRLKTKTNATTFPDADILAYANIIKDDIAKEVTKANEDYFGMKFLRYLIAGQRGYSF
jgi:lauroyl/myristoyl acyltransferase